MVANARWAVSDILTAAKLNASIQRWGADADKGTPTLAGESYLATDTLKLYISTNGSSWGYYLKIDGITNNEVAAGAAIAWSKISKTGSNLNEIVTRSHTVLSDIGANAHSVIDTHIAAASPHSSHTITTSGNYAGDSTVNRAIPHGLGRTPKMVDIVGDGTVLHIKIIRSGYIDILSAGAARYAVTAWDATNFYVGNATDYEATGNLTGINFWWVASG